MSIIAYTGSPALPKIPGGAVLANSTTYTKDSLVYRDTVNSVVKPVTSSAGTTENIEGIFTDATVTTAASGTVTGNVQMLGTTNNLYIVDCTNTTAANQLYKAQPMSNATTVNNTSTTTTGPLGIFIPLAISGNNTTQLIGYFVKVGQQAN